MLIKDIQTKPFVKMVPFVLSVLLFSSQFFPQNFPELPPKLPPNKPHKYDVYKDFLRFGEKREVFFNSYYIFFILVYILLFLFFCKEVKKDSPTSPISFKQRRYDVYAFQFFPRNFPENLNSSPESLYSTIKAINFYIVRFSFTGKGENIIGLSV